MRSRRLDDDHRSSMFSPDGFEGGEARLASCRREQRELAAIKPRVILRGGDERARRNPDCDWRRGAEDRRHARSRSADLRSVADHVRIGMARNAAARSAKRRAMMASQVRSGHRTGLIVVSKSPTRPTSSPDSDKRRAISNATSPPEE